MIITNNIQNHTEVLKKLSVSDAGELAQDVARLDAEVGNIEINISDEYSEDVEYEVGDYCTHNGTLYICTSSTTGAWASADWEPTSITDELKKNEGSGTLSVTAMYIYNANEASAKRFTISSKKNVVSFKTTATSANVAISKDGAQVADITVASANPLPNVLTDLDVGEYSFTTTSSQTSSTYKLSINVTELN